MHTPSCIYAALLASSLASASRLATPRPLPQPCGPCLATDDYLLTTTRAPHAALRFLYQGQWVTPQAPFATYDSLTDANALVGFQQQDQLRFGAVYLVKGTYQPMTAGYLRSVICVHGRDTMQVYVQPDHKYPYWVYDSIPFRPGRYEVMAPQSSRYSLAFTPHQLDSVGLATVSFAAYYRQHRAELDRANPFANCTFSHKFAREYSPAPDGYVPHHPTDIFNLLLGHSTYLKRRGWYLRALTPHELVPFRG